MIVTYKNFKNLKFPLYLLPSDNWHSIDRILFLNNQVIDDKNMPGETIGIRRLQCNRYDLLPLKKAVMNIPSLIRCKTKFFVDSRGKPFVYTKTLNSKLKTYRVLGVEKKETASLLWVHDIPHPFTIDRPPLNDPEWVRLLHIGFDPWIVYDYVRLPVKDTYRRV